MTHEDILMLLMTYKYLIVIPVAVFEGPIIGVMLGFLVSLGYFSLIPVYVILTLCDFIPDVTYYFVGHFAHRKQFFQKYGSKINVNASHLDLVKKLWFSHTHGTMLVSKLAYGISAILLISAGVVRLPLQRFMKSSYLIALVQYAVFLSTGYYFGQFYVALATYIDYAGYVVAGLVVLFLIAYFMSARRAKAVLLRTLKERSSELPSIL